VTYIECDGFSNLRLIFGDGQHSIQDDRSESLLFTRLHGIPKVQASLSVLDGILTDLAANRSAPGPETSAMDPLLVHPMKMELCRLRIEYTDPIRLLFHSRSYDFQHGHNRIVP
jgi:hypothetical protein